MNHIGLVTDSTADLPDNLIEEHQIQVVPNIMIINGQSVVDGQGMSRTDFYNQLPEMKILPTTATASPGRYQEVYEKLFQNGASQIISIHASSLLSGIFNAASSAASYFNNRVQVIDSHQVTLGLGFQVLAAAEAIKKGASLESIIKQIEKVRQRVRVIAMIDTLEYIRRSGRVSWAKARIGDLLSLKAFLEIRDGTAVSLGTARTRQKGIEYLIKLFKKIGALERMAILHTNAEADANQFLEAVNPERTIPAFIVNITTIIGTHVGPRGLGFVALHTE